MNGLISLLALSIPCAVVVGSAVLASGAAAQSERAPEHGADTSAPVLLDRKPVEIPRYRDIRDRPLIEFYTDEESYTRARSDPNYRLERLTYLSDGLAVVAFLYGERRRAARPTIVFNRGSYVRNDAAPEYLSMFHRLARSGYTILAPMYRGSEGAPGRDEMGGEDLNDLMQTVRLSEELSSADVDRLYLLGESRGGMMVLQAIRDGFPARAAAIYGSPTDFFALFQDQPDVYEPVADQLWPDWRREQERLLHRRSAVRWVDALDVPLLIMHGGDDQSMPVSQSLALSERLQALGKNYELHVFGYEGHALSGRAAERDALAVAWFERHAGDRARVVP